MTAATYKCEVDWDGSDIYDGTATGITYAVTRYWAMIQILPSIFM